MDMTIPPLESKTLLESNPLKSRILVRRLAVRESRSRGKGPPRLRVRRRLRSVAAVRNGDAANLRDKFLVRMQLIVVCRCLRLLVDDVYLRLLRLYVDVDLNYMQICF